METKRTNELAKVKKLLITNPETPDWVRGIIAINLGWIYQNFREFLKLIETEGVEREGDQKLEYRKLKLSHLKLHLEMLSIFDDNDPHLIETKKRIESMLEQVLK
jgi:hypothetical protein